MSYFKNTTYIVFAFLLCIFVCNCQEQSSPSCETIGDADFCFCNNDTACSDEQISCLYRTCRIFCNGENSCQNLTVYIEEHIGFVLGCNGLNACLGVWVLGQMFDNNPCPNPNSTEPTQIVIDPTEPTYRLSAGVTLGIFFGVIGIVILFVIGIFIYKHFFKNNINTADRIRMI